MSLTMYDASVNAFIPMLHGVSSVLKKSAAYAKEQGIDESVLLTARHRPDMFNFTRQVQIVSDHAKASVCRLAGKDVPSWEDNETSFEQLQARIDKTIAHLKAVKPEDVNGTEDKTIAIPIRGNEMTFPGLNYLLNFVHPNFYFHATTAYTLMREAGVPLGKLDFFGRG